MRREHWRGDAHTDCRSRRRSSATRGRPRPGTRPRSPLGQGFRQSRGARRHAAAAAVAVADGAARAAPSSSWRDLRVCLCVVSRGSATKGVDTASGGLMQATLRGNVRVAVEFDNGIPGLSQIISLRKRRGLQGTKQAIVKPGGGVC